MIRNGIFVIFLLTLVFIVIGLGNLGCVFINSYGKNMVECLEFISVYCVMVVWNK